MYLFLPIDYECSKWRNHVLKEYSMLKNVKNRYFDVSGGNRLFMVLEREGNQIHHGFKIFYFLDLLKINHITISQSWLLTKIKSDVASPIHFLIRGSLIRVLEFISWVSVSLKKKNLRNEALTLATHLKKIKKNNNNPFIPCPLLKMQ